MDSHRDYLRYDRTQSYFDCQPGLHFPINWSFQMYKTFSMISFEILGKHFLKSTLGFANDSFTSGCFAWGLIQ